MSPDLERLLNAIWESRHADPLERRRWKASVERMIQDALGRLPGTSREELLVSLELRLVELSRKRKRPTTLPPQA